MEGAGRRGANSHEEYAAHISEEAPDEDAELIEIVGGADEETSGLLLPP